MIPTDHSLKLRTLARAVQGGTISPLALAERAYHMGSIACHEAMAPAAPAPETLNLIDLEKLALSKAISQTGNIAEAAKLLGIGKTTAYRKAKEYGITPAPVVCPNCHRPLERRPPCPTQTAA
jgi:transcriptional regulator of acetoin/glycerol metabolism